jgi:hypothetical protein
MLVNCANIEIGIALNHLVFVSLPECGFPFLLLYFALAFSIAGLLLTVKAAPIMLGLASSESAAAAQRALEEFYLWGLYSRGFADTLAFAALIWALSNLRQQRT